MKISRLALLFISILACSLNIFGQDSSERKIAAYSAGKYGTKEYEHFSFYAVNGKPTEINYSYGKNDKSATLTYTGTDTLNNEKCFKIQFANGLTLYVIPKGLRLKVVDKEGKFSKLLSWRYEGPIDGRGTACNDCADDAKEAMKIIKRYFLK